MKQSKIWCISMVFVPLGYALHHITPKHVTPARLSGISFVVLFLFQHPDVQELHIKKVTERQ